MRQTNSLKRVCDLKELKRALGAMIRMARQRSSEHDKSARRALRGQANAAKSARQRPCAALRMQGDPARGRPALRSQMRHLPTPRSSRNAQSCFANSSLPSDRPPSSSAIRYAPAGNRLNQFFRFFAAAAFRRTARRADFNQIDSRTLSSPGVAQERQRASSTARKACFRFVARAPGGGERQAHGRL